MSTTRRQRRSDSRRSLVQTSMTLNRTYLLTRWSMTTTEKTCFKCNRTLPLEAFYKHKQMGDGHLNKCKECTKLDAGNHRQLNIDRIREYDRERGNRWKPMYLQEYRAANEDKYRAHTIVGAATRTGRLKKLPCFICGCEKTEAHHPNYQTPLDVVWLCPAHHKQAHALAKKFA